MKLLVSTASRHGSTDEIGDALAGHLRELGVEVDRRSPDRVRDLQGYDGVVIGSAVYLGKWLKPATALLDRLVDQLGGRAVWLFSSGPTGPVSDPGSLPDLTDVLARTGAREHRVFAGKVDVDGLGRIERLMIRAAKAPSGDVRDWEDVRLWADVIADTLPPRV